MALPTWVGVGTQQNGTGPLTAVTWPAGHQADDIGILIVETANQTITTPAGWTLITTQGIGTAGAAGATKIYAFWKRATSSAEVGPDVDDSGDHTFARVVAVRGCHAAGDPVNITSGDTAASSTAVSIPGLTTTAADCFVVAIVANGIDLGTTQGSGAANASLSGVSLRFQQQKSDGVGGGFSVVTGGKAVAGAVSATTLTLATAGAQARIAFALKAPDVGTATFGGIYMATGVKAAAGAIGASSTTFFSAAAQGRMTIALKPPVVVTNLPPVLAAIPDLFAFVGDAFEFPVVATDPEAAAITYTVFPGSTILPPGLTIDPTLGILRWSPPQDLDEGTWNITVRATDVGGLFDEQTVNITVTGGPARAIDIAARAQADLDAAQVLVDFLLDTQQMNANVIMKAQALLADLTISKQYIDDVITDIETP